MDDITIIDAQKCLDAKAIKRFKEQQSDDTIVTLYIEEAQIISEKPMKEIRKFFEDESIENSIPNENSVIHFMTDTKLLVITGADFFWRTAVVRNKKYGRLDKLFEETNVDVKQDKKKQIVYCACGVKINDNIENISKFEGTQKDLLNFINGSYQQHQIRSMFTANVVFFISDSNFEEIHQIDKWQTYDELIEKGVFVK